MRWTEVLFACGVSQTWVPLTTPSLFVEEEDV